MELYEKIKQFVAINPAPMHIGTYLKDSKKVSEIYYELLALESIEDFEEAEKKEKELDERIDEILKHWKS